MSSGHPLASPFREIAKPVEGLAQHGEGFLLTSRCGTYDSVDLHGWWTRLIEVSQPAHLYLGVGPWRMG